MYVHIDKHLLGDHVDFQCGKSDKESVQINDKETVITKQGSLALTPFTTTVNRYDIFFRTTANRILSTTFNCSQ